MTSADRQMDTFLVTGATGFLGRRLIVRLLADSPTAAVVAMTRPADPQQDDARRYLAAQAERSAGRVEWVTGDITKPMLGLDAGQIAGLANRGPINILHLAALYDLEVEEGPSKALNLDGAVRAYETALAVARHPGRAGRPVRFCQTSTLAVAGNYAGVFGETGQELELSAGTHTDWYARHKFEAELALRKLAAGGEVPLMIVRPGIAVGDSTTGEIEKLDGPYGLLEYLSWPVVRHLLPWSGNDPFWIVPGDFVVRAMAALAANPQAYGKTFNLLYPPEDNPAWSDFLRYTLEVLRSPSYTRRSSEGLAAKLRYGWYIPVPTKVLIGSGRLPLVGGLVRRFFSALGAEPNSLPYAVANPRFEVANYRAFGVEPPRPWRDMWRACILYYRDHRDEMRAGAVVAHQKAAKS